MRGRTQWHCTYVTGVLTWCCDTNPVPLVCKLYLTVDTGAMGGRIDHTLSNLNTLLTHAHLNLVLLGDNSTARLLPAGSCTVRPAPVRLLKDQPRMCYIFTSCKSATGRLRQFSLPAPLCCGRHPDLLAIWMQGLEGPACSLVPLAGPAVATSSGLKWNLSESACRHVACRRCLLHRRRVTSTVIMPLCCCAWQACTKGASPVGATR